LKSKFPALAKGDLASTFRSGLDEHPPVRPRQQPPSDRPLQTGDTLESHQFAAAAEMVPAKLPVSRALPRRRRAEDELSTARMRLSQNECLMSKNVVSTRRTRLVMEAADLAIEATAAEAVEALHSAGIRTIVLKGPALAHWLYDSQSTRLAADVDLLIAVADRSAAETVLAELGYRAFPSNVAGGEIKHAHHWDRELNPISVDLHLTLPGVAVSNENAWCVLSQDTEQLVVGGTEVEVLAPAARAMHIALHAAQHGPGFEGPMEDLERALDQLPPEIWDEAAALARRLDAESMFAAGLGLRDHGREILARLGLSDQKTVEAALRATTPPDLALGFHQLASAPGLRPKLAFVARKIVPPAAWMRRWVPLAKRGRLGLATAYLIRPLWLLRRAGPGFRAWRRAVKDTR
jgi:hypothetical protein